MKEQQNSTTQSLILDSKLVTFLKSQDNHKFSRYDAFIWIIDQIHATANNEVETTTSAYQELLVKYTELAKTWRWSRPTVQKFIEGLEAMSVIIKRKHVNAFALSLPNENTMDDSQTDFSTPYPTTEPMLASHHSQPSSVSLLKATRGKRESNRGKGCV